MDGGRLPYVLQDRLSWEASLFSRFPKAGVRRRLQRVDLGRRVVSTLLSVNLQKGLGRVEIRCRSSHYRAKPHATQDVAMFFSRARKWKKVGDAVLAEVHPLVLLAERQTGKKISVLSGDNYILGFITGLSAITAKRVGVNLNHEDSGMILHLVIDQIYG